jgi:hypothetical protein
VSWDKDVNKKKETKMLCIIIEASFKRKQYLANYTAGRILYLLLFIRLEQGL